MEPSTAHVLLETSYVVLSSVKSDEKSYIGATATFRPARQLQRLRHHRSSADRRQHGAQHRARIADHVVRGAELREERREVAYRGDRHG
ncbi:hypothetical protein PR003_g30450 [Phytophthora rubi]|uniref:Uncharacterized protein n=1 Tax=Phytophthora rubi TaxID=129364 RepID=A0A6A4BJ38_9STRA|nr:hypothetical protein PR003_g30450 [Phytophthora rubi]